MRRSIKWKKIMLPSKTQEEYKKEEKELEQGDFLGIVEQDKQKINQLYSSPSNIDFVTREFILPFDERKVVLFYVPSLTDTKLLDEEVIKPLITANKPILDLPSSVSVSAIQDENTLSKAIKELNIGNTLLLIEGDKKSYVINTHTAANRSVDKPQNETTLLGPKESFVERADINISLIRKKIRSEDFMVELTVVGERSNNEVFIVYNKKIANEKVINEVKKRVKTIQTDAIPNLSLLVQYIEDRKLSLFPTVLQTERPDRAASFIEEGFVALIMNNSPFALIAPATFWSFYHSSDDHFLRFSYGNFTRFLRAVALFITLFTPSIYIAVTNFHNEMMPPDLLLAIAGAREIVPFPAIVELILMELAFELIREAGLRVPQPIGPTIGIVGALIIGEAAVEANVVSPIVVIVVALTGLSSYAISDVNLNYAARIVRFGFLLSASILGIFGMVACFMIGLFYISTLKSFGVSYLAPLTPKYSSSGDTVFRKLLKNERLRPAFVKPKDSTTGPQPER